MARVLTNNTTLQYAIESSIGTLPGSPAWRQLEPNNISSYGATITTVERRPISPTRGRKKGTVTNLESAVEFDGDLTMDSFDDFAEGFVFSEFANVEFDLTHSKLNGAALDTDTTGDTFELSSSDFASKTNGAELVSKITWAAGAARTLWYARGYVAAVNNGLHEQAAAVTGTDTGIPVTTNLTTETAPTNARVEVAGVRIGDSDLTLTVSGSTATLVSAADVTDWAALGLYPGQFIHIGGVDTNGAVQNALNASATDDTYGYARITSISGATLNLDKLDATLATADNSSEGDADILFGRFLRNVATSADSNDSRYLERSYQFEAAYPDLGGAGNDEFEYAVGNFADEWAINYPLEDKATCTWGFVGTNTEPIVVAGSRKTNAASAVAPVRTTAVNTSSDIVSLTTDVVSLASDVCFKSLTITLRNNVTPETCIGTLGASYVNAGLFEVNMEGQMLFTNKEIANAVRENTTVTFASIFRNDNGGVAIDIPSLTFGGGDKEFPVDESVLVNVTGLAFNDPTGTIPNVSLGVSLFAVVPTA